MILSNIVGKRIKELIFKKGYSQYRLMRESGLTTKTIADLINGKTSDVKFNTVWAILNTIGVSWKEFVDSPLFDTENIDN